MLAGPDTLYSLAEISVEIAGFAAIVVLFKRGTAGKWRRDDADRFNGMLIHAMFAILFCLLPTLISVFTTKQSLVWSIASSVLAIQILIHAGVIARLASTDSRVRAGVLLLALAPFSLQVMNVFEIYFTREVGPYFAGVLWHLLHAGVLFVGLVWVRDVDTEAA